jgi:D-alanyl-D-alanine carboxypeptidase
VDDAAVLERVGDWIDRRRERFVGPAVVVGLTDRERTLGTLVLGESGPGEPIRDDHLFLIASVSKSFTAALVMQEVAAGRLGLDEGVTTYLPWFTPPSDHAPITVHHLLTHTAGIATGCDITGDAIEELLTLTRQEVAGPPGEHHAYSNAGYKALGLVLETVTGRPWWELARERLLEPLEMRATEPVITDDVRPRLAAGWVPPLDDRPWHPGHGLVHAPWYESYTADGTICSNAADLVAYVRMFLRDGGPVLPPEGVDRMTAGDVDDPDSGTRYGYGLWAMEREGRRLVGHSGSLPGYRAMILFDRQRGYGACVLTNGGVTWDLRLELLAFALSTAGAASAGDELPPLPEPASLRTIVARDRLAGRWTDGEVTIDLDPDGDGLQLVVGEERSALVSSGDGLVAAIAPWDRYAFRAEDADAGVVRLLHGPNVFAREDALRFPPPAHDPAWGAFVGRYRAYGIEPMCVEVLLREGRLWLLWATQDEESELVPLDDGRFRIGTEPWQPGRARFEAPVGDDVRRLVLDGATFVRVP